MLCKVQKPYGNRIKNVLYSSEQENGDEEFGDDLCLYSWDVALSHLNNQAYPHLPTRYDKNLETPLFVTWNTLSNDNKEVLRGCIGCLEKLKLSPGLKDYTIKAAFQDSRFSPINFGELSGLVCRVSILHTFESCSLFDWEIGTHGIIIHYNSPNGRHYTATYLPEIPLEHGMTHESAMEDLTKKAGYQLPRTAWNSEIKVTRYQSKRVRMTAQEYLQIRPGAF